MRVVLNSLLVCAAILVSGCQVAITCVHVYPEGSLDPTKIFGAEPVDVGASETVELTDNADPGVSVNLAFYKSNAGKANNVNQKTDAAASIPASLLGGSNTNK